MGPSTCPWPVQYFNLCFLDEGITGLLVISVDKTKLERIFNLFDDRTEFQK